MSKTLTRDAKGRFLKVQPLKRSRTKQELDIEVQKLSPGFYPNRTVETLQGLDPGERLVRANMLAKQFAELGLECPAALLILL